jgi:hypothetical protein
MADRMARAPLLRSLGRVDRANPLAYVGYSVCPTKSTVQEIMYQGMSRAVFGNSLSTDMSELASLLRFSWRNLLRFRQ